MIETAENLARATLVGWAAAGCELSHMGIGPLPAVRKLTARLGLKLNQMDLGRGRWPEAPACEAKGP
jgi:acetyl-CoA acetyltransferase